MQSAQATSVVLLATLVSTMGAKPSSSLPELLSKNFRKVPGNSLMGNETATLEVDDSLDCSFTCVEDLECFSFNFGTSSSMERPRKICELSNSIMEWDPQNFKGRPGFDYYGMDPADRPCLSSPCNNGGLCTEPLGRYECACPLEIRVLPYIDDKCNVEMDQMHDNHPNSGVFFAYAGSHNQLNFYEAERLCEIFGARLATYDQLYRAWENGYEKCMWGWLSDSTVRLPMQEAREACGNKIGIYGSDQPKNKASTFNAYCHR